MPETTYFVKGRTVTVPEETLPEFQAWAEANQLVPTKAKLAYIGDRSIWVGEDGNAESKAREYADFLGKKFVWQEGYETSKQAQRVEATETRADLIEKVGRDEARRLMPERKVLTEAEAAKLAPPTEASTATVGDVRDAAFNQAQPQATKELGPTLMPSRAEPKPFVPNEATIGPVTPIRNAKNRFGRELDAIGGAAARMFESLTGRELDVDGKQPVEQIEPRSTTVQRLAQLPGDIATSITPDPRVPEIGETRTAFMAGLLSYKNDQALYDWRAVRDDQGNPFAAAIEKHDRNQELIDLSRVTRASKAGRLGQSAASTIGPAAQSVGINILLGPVAAFEDIQRQGYGRFVSDGMKHYGIDPRDLTTEEIAQIDGAARAWSGAYAAIEYAEKALPGGPGVKALKKFRGQSKFLDAALNAYTESGEEGFQKLAQDGFNSQVAGILKDRMTAKQLEAAPTLGGSLKDAGATALESLPTVLVAFSGPTLAANLAFGGPNAKPDDDKSAPAPVRPTPPQSPQQPGADASQGATPPPDAAPAVLSPAQTQQQRQEAAMESTLQALEQAATAIRQAQALEAPATPAVEAQTQPQAPAPTVEAAPEPQAGPPAPLRGAISELSQNLHPSAAPERQSLETQAAPPISASAPESTAPSGSTEDSIANVESPVSPVARDQIALRPDLMQFKRMSDTETGEAESHKDTIGGKWDDVKAGNLLLWEPADPAAHGLKNGEKYIVADGHGRVNYGDRQGTKAFNAQVVRETDGYSAQDARILAAEKNIADGKGTIYDQAKFLRNESAAHGADAALERARQIGIAGRKAATIAFNASDPLFDSFVNEQVTPDQAAAIAAAAPGNESAQRLGIKYAIQGREPAFIQNVMRASTAGAAQASVTLDLFGADDSAMKSMEAQAERASQIQRGISEQIRSVQGAARRPEVAARLGVDVKDPEGVNKRLAELKAELSRWDNWPVHPDMVAQVREPKATPTAQSPSVPRPGAQTPAVGTRVKLTDSPQTATIEKVDVDPETGETFYDLKKERGGEVVRNATAADFAPVAAKPEGQTAAPKRDLDAELREAGMDPSAFKSAKQKAAALKRAGVVGKIEAGLRKAKIPGKIVFDAILGLPVIVYNGAIDAAIAVVRAGGAIADAVARAVAYINANYSGKWDRARVEARIVEAAMQEPGVAPTPPQRPPQPPPAGKADSKSTRYRTGTHEYETTTEAARVEEAQRVLDRHPDSFDEAFGDVQRIADLDVRGVALAMLTEDRLQAMQKSGDIVERDIIRRQVQQASDAANQAASDSGSALQARKQDKRRLAPYEMVLMYYGMLKERVQRVVDRAIPVATQQPIIDGVKRSGVGAGEVLADQMVLEIDGTSEKPETEAEKRKRADKTAESIVASLARIQSDTQAWGATKTDAIRKATADYIAGRIDRETYAAALNTQGVSEENQRLLDWLATREIANRAAVEEARQRLREKQAPDKTAEAIIDAFASTQSDVQAWGDKKRNAIRDAVREYVESKVNREALEGRLAELGVSAPNVAKLATLAEREVISRRMVENAQIAPPAKKEAQKRTIQRIVAALKAAGTATLKAGDINWRDLFRDLPESQTERQAAIFERVRAERGFDNMPEQAQRILASSLDQAWNAIRNQIIEAELKRITATLDVTPTVRAKIEKAFPEIIYEANLGLFNHDSFRRALAQRFGLPSMDDDVARRIETLAMEAQVLPRGVARNQAYDAIQKIINDNKRFSFWDYARDAWYENVLSGTQTMENVLLGSGFTTLANTARNSLAATFTGHPVIAARMWQAQLGALAEGVANFADIVRTGDRTRLATFEGEVRNRLDDNRGPSGALEALRRSDAIWKRAIGSLFYTRRFMTGLDYLLASGGKQPEILAAALFRGDRTAMDAAMRQFDRGETARAMAQAKQEIPGAKWVNLKQRAREILSEGISDEIDTAANLSRDRNAQNTNPTSIIGKWLWNSPHGAGISRWPWVWRTITATNFIRAAIVGVENFSEWYPGAGLIPLARGGITNAMKAKGQVAPEWFSYDLPPERRNQIIASQLIGMTVTLGLAGYVLGLADKDDDDGFEINGSWKGLTPDKKRQLMNLGERPYSVRFTKDGKPIPFLISGPLAAPLVIAGNMRDRQRFNGEKWTAETVAAHVVRPWLSGMMSWADMSSISKLGGVTGIRATSLQEPEDRIGEIVRAPLSSAMSGLTPTLLREIDMLHDPRIYSASKDSLIWEHMLRQIPVARRANGEGPQLNQLGEDARQYRGFFSRFVGEAHPDTPAWSMLAERAREGAFLPNPDSIRSGVDGNGERRAMTEAERYDFKSKLLAERKARINAELAYLKGLTREEWIEETTRIHKRAAKDVLREMDLLALPESE